MESGAYLYAIILFGFLGGYWYLTQGRHGKDFYKSKFGLEPGENLKPNFLFVGQYFIENDLTQKVVDVLTSTQTVGKMFHMILTDKNRLIIRNAEKGMIKNLLTEFKPELQIYSKEDISGAVLKEETKATTVGPKGKEKMVLIEFTFKNKSPLPVLVGESAFYEINSWLENK